MLGCPDTALEGADYSYKRCMSTTREAPHACTQSKMKVFIMVYVLLEVVKANKIIPLMVTSICRCFDKCWDWLYTLCFLKGSSSLSDCHLQKELLLTGIFSIVNRFLLTDKKALK